MIVAVVVAVQVVSVNFILQSPGAVVLLCVHLPVSVGGLVDVGVGAVLVVGPVLVVVVVA